MPVRLVHQQVASCNRATASRASSATTAGYPAPQNTGFPGPAGSVCPSVTSEPRCSRAARSRQTDSAAPRPG